ncbi:MAG: transporter substrate-binding domain-containing protein [Aquificales bacterium]|nr:transporter substrate-binding domain-containing protein [Aquificales bacterium]
MDNERLDDQPIEEYETDNDTAENEQGKDEGPLIKILNIAIVALVIVACLVLSYLAFLMVTDGRSDNQPTPTPTSPIQNENAWNRIQGSGKIVVGTAVDYPPFEYYDKEYRVDGYDIALINEIARRWGVAVEVKDIAFDGLGNSVRLGNVDLAISALSVTSDRENNVNFSDVYYVGEDALLANSNGSIQSITNIRELAQYTIGVQRGSVYADFVHENLIKTGLMPESNLYEYLAAGDAVRDLVENRVQVVLLDLQPAQVATNHQPVKIVGQGLKQQRLAIAIQQGQTDLQNQLNTTLTEMRNDGSLNKLAEEYLDVSELIPPEPPVTPEPTVTPNPAVTPEPEKCIDDATWVEDLSYNDQNMTNLPQLAPGEKFRKGWQMRNSGTCTWDSTYRLDYDEGNSPASRMNGAPVYVQGIVAPEQTYDLWVDLVAPLQPGEYVGFWHMINGENLAFGSRVWVAVDVVGPATPTPVATSTPTVGIDFTVDRTTIQAGECVNFSWSVTNASAVYFYAMGENWWEHQVPLVGTKVECPPSTMTYELRVVKTDGTVVVQQLTINVIPNPEAPKIDRFTVNPNLIVSSECVHIQWQVSGEISEVTIYRDSTAIWAQAPVRGEMEDCPPGAGQYVYKLEANGSGGNSVAQETVSVTEPTQPTPTGLPPTATATAAPPTATSLPTITPAPNTPTAVPPTATPLPPTPTPQPPPTAVLPNIANFTVNPKQIQTGECVTVAWSVTGDISNIQFAKNGTVVYETNTVNGTVPDCSNEEAGSITYTITASNNSGQSDSADQVITVTAVQPTPAPTAEPLPIVGDWQLVTYRDGAGNMVNVVSQTPLTASFLVDGRLLGFAGCNSFNATYRADASNLAIENITATKQSCPDEALMTQETAYLADIADAATYTVNGDQMTINDSNGQPLLTYKTSFSTAAPTTSFP